MADPLQNLSQAGPSRNFLSQPSGDVAMTPDQQAAVVFDMSCIRMWGNGAGKQVALRLQVSESLVSRWRSADYRELPSIGQVAALGPDFIRLLQKEQGKFYGFSRQALLDLIAVVEDLARECA